LNTDVFLFDHGIVKQFTEPRGFREKSDVVVQRLEAHVGSLEVSLEHPHEVIPIVDLSRWEILELGSSGVRQEQGELPDDDPVIGGPTQLTCQVEVSEPKFRFGLAVILGKSHGGVKPSWEYRFANGLAKDPRTRWLG
jgi:hypothetical protein